MQAGFTSADWAEIAQQVTCVAALHHQPVVTFTTTGLYPGLTHMSSNVRVTAKVQAIVMQIFADMDGNYDQQKETHLQNRLESFRDIFFWAILQSHNSSWDVKWLRKNEKKKKHEGKQTSA